MIRPVPCLSLALLTAWSVLPARAADAQVRDAYDTGTAALQQALERLQTTASVLHTGAHPDDEDSALLAWLARREHARTAYLSLTRGAGGQNAIGPEFFEALGVIRTEELLQARRYDGAGQLFTRAVDFGYTTRLAEAARAWDEDVVLGDMVRAIRLFRPLVVISRFSGTPADGHGHHQFAGYLTPLAVDAAADAARYPEHLDEGLAPWSVKKLYVSAAPDAEAGDRPGLRVNTGEFAPVLGDTYYAIGMRGRSRHRTQGMGSLELHGPQYSGLRLLRSGVATPDAETSVFDGIDTSIRGIAAYQAGASGDLLDLLGDIEAAAELLLLSYEPRAPERLIPLLAEGLRKARRAAAAASGADARHLLEQKVREFEAALVLAAGVVVDALADTSTVVPGDRLTVVVRAFLPTGSDVEVANLHLSVPEGWTARRADAAALPSEAARRFVETPVRSRAFAIAIPEDAPPTQPYWLERPAADSLYDWSGAGDARNRPFGPSLLTAEVRLVIGGQTVLIRREVEHRSEDPVLGELRRRIDVVPAVTLTPEADLLVVPAGATGEDQVLEVTLGNGRATAQEGVVSLALPEGWRSTPAEAAFSLPYGEAIATRRFRLALPAGTAVGRYRVDVAARIDGVEYGLRQRTIAYPHIRTHRLYERASVGVRVVDATVAPVRVGYVMGSGDRVPEALESLGVPVTLLDDEALASADLSRFDTIVVGVRAAGARPAFVANNERLLDFAREGGALIVQYQRYDYVERGLPPFPARMDGNLRVTDEAAPVTVLEPEHPVFTSPNAIGPADFDGWVQERNAYTFTGFDRDRYTPLLESHDAGEPESDGGMLYARLGEGHYVYTSYALFRQLPAGVPGAYRLLANLVSLGAAP